MIPFGDPHTWGKERDLYHARLAGASRIPLALFNEIGNPENLDEPTQPDGLTVVYGVRIYDRYLAGFDPDRGPILKDLVAGGTKVAREKSAGAGGAGSPRPNASPTPGPPVPTESPDPGEAEASRAPGSPGD